MAEFVRVLLVDDHAIVREGLRSVLERGGEIHVVGEAATGGDAIFLTGTLAPDLVLMDFALPDITGVAACAAIRAAHPAIRVLFLSMHEEEAYFMQALRAGAAGYLIKRSAASEIREAILGTCRGEVYLAPTLATVLVRHVTQATEGPVPDPLAPLTTREREILHHVAGGDTNQMIASHLGISIKTVQTHRASIMEKLQLRDTTHLVRFAIHHGVIPNQP